MNPQLVCHIKSNIGFEIDNSLLKKTLGKLKNWINLSINFRLSLAKVVPEDNSSCIPENFAGFALMVVPGFFVLPWPTW